MQSAATESIANAAVEVEMTAPPTEAAEVSTAPKAASLVPATAEELHQALNTRDESLTLKWLEEASSSLLTARWLFTTDMGDGTGNLFLHMICTLNLAQTLQRLLASPATINLFVRNAAQETPLHVCASDTRAVLLAEGRRRSCMQDLLSATDVKGWGVLDYAVHRRDWRGAEQLRAEGAVCLVKDDPCPRLLVLPTPSKEVERKYRHPHMIQFASDLHLEFYSTWEDVKLCTLIHPVAPYLALLGDIGIPSDRDLYRRFLLAMAQQFERVFVLAGNHEYYDSRLSVQETDELITDICASHPHLVYCKRASISLFDGRVRLLATSALWSYIPPYAVNAVEMGMMDFKKIRVGHDRRPLSFAQVNEWHHDTVAWISQELRRSSARGERVVVLSHQAPSFLRTSPSQFRGPLLNQTSFAFASNLEMLFRKFNWEHSRVENSVLDSWAFGHTHHNTDFTLHGTRLLCNQFGYVGGEEAPGYKPDRVIDLHLDSWIKGHGEIWRRFSRTPSY